MGTLLLIGHWRWEYDSGLPDVNDFIDPTWDLCERAAVSRHLDDGAMLRKDLGAQQCLLCGKVLGHLVLTDGAFAWPEGLAHYVSEHHVRLPQRFVDYVLARSGRYHRAEPSDAWWRELAVKEPVNA